MAGTVTGAAGIAILGAFVLLTQQYGLRMPSPAPGQAMELPEDYFVKPAALTGAYAANNRLGGATKLFDGQIQGAESAAVASDGSLVLATREGGIWRASQKPDGSFKLDAKPFARATGGRPLGLHYDKDDNLIICNAGKGLEQVVKGSTAVTPLATRTTKDGVIPATPILYANDLDIAPDGTIYFTDSGHFPPQFSQAKGFHDTMSACVLMIAQGLRAGRLLAYSPASKKTSVVAEEFLFPNGVAVSADGKYLLMVETGAARIWKIWLQGAKAGHREVFLDQLPGYPDGVSRSQDGQSFWVAIVTPPTLLTKAAPYRWLRWVLAWVPSAISSKLIPKWGCILQVTPEGKVLQMLMDPKGEHVATVSAVLDLGEQLILGSLGGSYLAAVPLHT